MNADGAEILNVSEMQEVDRLAVEAGVPSLTLMENAGRQVANEIAKRWSPRPTVVLCGPGNNGGDGYVVARHLQARGYSVEVASAVDIGQLRGDAKAMATQWTGRSRRLEALAVEGAALVVDAVFGAGLSRPLASDLSAVFSQLNVQNVPIVAVDVPSGVDGDRANFVGEVAAWSAALTVTFFRLKPAHVLMPSREVCGEVVCADIGIPASSLEKLRKKTPGAARCSVNAAPVLAAPRASGHKYSRGHCVVLSGPAHATGAARLAARAALRVGAGLVSVGGPKDALPVLASALTTVMVRQVEDATNLATLLQDARFNAVVVGPGNGVNEDTRRKTLAALASGASVVVDADGLTSFAKAPSDLFAKLHPCTVLTPHEGEFERLFPGVRKSAVNKIEAVRVAARTSKAVVLLKGPDTVIAAPDGRAVVNVNATADLATAGSGDVLAGIIAGLMAQGLGAFEAASGGAYLHGLAGRLAARGLIAEDLPDYLPDVLKSLENSR